MRKKIKMKRFQNLLAYDFPAPLADYKRQGCEFCTYKRIGHVVKQN